MEPTRYNSIRPGQVWLDTEGKRIQAHAFAPAYRNLKDVCRSALTLTQTICPAPKKAESSRYINVPLAYTRH